MVVHSIGGSSGQSLGRRKECRMLAERRVRARAKGGVWGAVYKRVGVGIWLLNLKSFFINGFQPFI